MARSVRVNCLALAAASWFCCPWPAEAAPEPAQATPPSSSGKQTAPEKPKAPKPPKPPRKPWAPDTRKWDIEFHVAAGFGSTSDGGSGELPKPGATFTTGGGADSRHVPSWFFGDGARLFNDVLAALGRAEAIVPLDPAITGPAVEQTVENAIGVRVTRALTPILAIEVEGNVARSTYTVRQETKNALDATSDSFFSAFGGLVASGQGVAFTSPALSSSFNWQDGQGADIVTTVSLVIHPKKDGRVRPYVVVGGGVAASVGQAQATLTGRYSFRVPDGGTVDESDTVTIHFGGGVGLAGVAGAGLNFRVTRGSGIRVDARGQFLENHVPTSIDAHPSAVASNPAQAVWSFTTPALQFVTNPSTGLASSLDTSGLSGVTTLHASGFYSRASITVGYFWRF